jgi:hypothetical protein
MASDSAYVARLKTDSARRKKRFGGSGAASSSRSPLCSVECDERVENRPHAT